MRRLAVEGAEALQCLVQAVAGASAELHELHVLHAVLLVATGVGCQTVARWLGHHPRTIERWVHRFNTVGAGQRAPSPMHPGRPARLSATLWAAVCADLTQPPESAAPRAAWTGARLQAHLARQHGVSLGLRQCQRLLAAHRAGRDAAAFLSPPEGAWPPCSPTRPG